MRVLRLRVPTRSGPMLVPVLSFFLATVLLIGSASELVPAASHDKVPAALGGVTMFKASRGMAFPVTLSKSLAVSPSQDGITLSSSGWSAFFLVRQPELDRRPTKPLMFGQVRIPSPAGCANGLPASAGCTDPRGLVLRTSFADTISGTATRPTLHYPPGRYVAYLLTEEGVSTLATLRIPGLTGIVEAAPGPDVKFDFASLTGNVAAGTAATLRDSVSQTVRRYGAVLDMTWAAHRPESQFGADSQKVCISRDSKPDGGVISGADKCWLLGGALPAELIMGQPQGSGGVLLHSSTYGVSTGGIIGVGVPRGTYTVDAAVTSTGDHPSAGAVMIAFDYVY